MTVFWGVAPKPGSGWWEQGIGLGSPAFGKLDAAAWGALKLLKKVSVLKTVS